MSLLRPIPPFENSVEAFLKAIPTSSDIPALSWTQPSIMLSALEDTSTLVLRLGSIIERLSDVHRIHAQRRAVLHNALRARTRLLPSEILGRIFELVVQSIDAQSMNSNLTEQVLSLTHTCSLWRRTAIGWRSLWCQMDLFQLRNNSVRRVWVERSYPAVVDVFYARTADTALIQELIPRLRSVSFPWDRLDAITTEGKTFERLESLRLCGEYVYHIYNWRMPALRRLHITHEFPILSLHPSVRSNLCSLVIKNVYDLDELASVLISLPNLERLRLSHSSLISTNMTEVERWTLQSLKHLRIDTMMDTRTCFFSGWTCPKLESLWYDGSYVDFESPSSWTLVSMSHFLDRSPLTESITFHTGKSDFDWRIPFQVVTKHIRTCVPPSLQFLPKLNALTILGHTDWNLGPTIQQFFTVRYEKHHENPLRDMGTAKVLDQLRLRHRHLIGQGDWIVSRVGSLEIVLGEEKEDTDDW